MSSLLTNKNLWYLVGYVEYNGVALPPAIQSELVASPVLDQSERRRASTKFTLTCEFVVHAGMTFSPIAAVPSGDLGSYTDDTNDPTNTVDSEVRTLRLALMQPGGLLIMRSKGYGDVAVYGNRTQYTAHSRTERKELDVANGPKPTQFNVLPYGNRAAKVTWTVEYETADCFSTGQPSEDISLLGLSWTQSTAIDKLGATNRTITGRAEIASVSNSLEFDRAEAAKAHLAFLFPLLNKFDREYTIDVAADRRQLNFVIRDTEKSSRNRYFPGVQDMNLDYSVESGLESGAFATWAASLSGTIDVFPGTSKIAAWTAFTLILKDLFANASEGEQEALSGSDDPLDAKIILNRLRVTDGLFSDSATFDAQWTLFATFKTMLKASGILVPLHNDYVDPAEGDIGHSDWRDYALNKQLPAGYQDLVYDPAHDAVVAICSNPVGAGGYTTPKPTEAAYDETPPTADNSTIDPKSGPDAWHRFDNYLTFSVDNKTAEANPVDDQQAAEDRDLSNSVPATIFQRIKDYVEQTDFLPTFGNPEALKATGQIPADVKPRSILRKTGRSAVRVKMKGRAVRLNSPAAPPELLQVGLNTDNGNNPSGIDISRIPKKIGKDKYATKMYRGVDLAGTQQQIWLSQWEQEYVLDSLEEGGELFINQEFRAAGHPDRLAT